MINVNYEIVYGEVFGHNPDGTKWKVQYHAANMKLGAFIYHYKENGVKMASLWNFLLDEKHVCNIMSDQATLLGSNVDKVKLNVYYKQAREIVEACAKSGYKVECYYKEPKKK